MSPSSARVAECIFLPTSTILRPAPPEGPDRERNAPVTRTSYPDFAPPVSRYSFRSSDPIPAAFNSRLKISLPEASFPAGR